MIDPAVDRPAARPHGAVALVPSVLTFANVVAGMLAVLLVVDAAAHRDSAVDVARRLDAAGWVVLAGMVLDVLDGVIARAARTTSTVGTELDSLADLVSFGVAPAVLATAFAGGFLVPGGEAPVALHALAIVLACAWVGCAAFRLARFKQSAEVTPSNPSTGRGRWFAGLPTTAAAGMAVVVVGLRDGEPLATSTQSLVYLAMLGALCALMASRWRYHSQRDLALIRPGTPVGALLYAGVLVGLVLATVTTLAVVAAAYVLSGVVARFRRTARAQPER
jgi:CDP-diacylglycerol---serine O-phosphatidyltransferase